MNKINRTKVRKAFDQGAQQYEKTVIVQKLVIERILSNLAKLYTQNYPLRILDVGAGTGLLLRSLRKVYPEAFLAGLDLAPGMGDATIHALQDAGNFLFVEGDAENLPFLDGSFDLVVSTSTFQWLPSLDRAFSEARRVLRPGGSFLFALFGEGTLKELKNSYRRALIAENAIDKDRTHNAFTQNDVEEDLYAVGFREIVVESFFEKEFYPDVGSFLRALKGIGAGTPASLSSQGLGGRRIIMAMTEIYRCDYSDEKGVPVSYEVVCGKGLKI